MPKKVKELSELQVRRLSFGVSSNNSENPSPCRAYHAVGGVAGLLLQCSPPSTSSGIVPRSWRLRVKVGDKRRDIGLGGYPDVTLAGAKEAARHIRAGIKLGNDPIISKKEAASRLKSQQAKAVTFSDLAKEYVTKKAKEFKTLKQSQKLENHLLTYVYPFIGNMIVCDIGRADIEQILKPIWETKNETASRVRLSVERILDLAAAKGLRDGYNPARWKGNLDLSFPARSKIAKVTSYKALQVKAIPQFAAKLKTMQSQGARALQFIILTAARSGEARGAQWAEIDLKKRIWTVPADRMKSGKDHVVPLSDSALELINSIPRISKYVFPNASGKMLSDVSVSIVPKKLGYDVTAHGLRSSFKDWCRLHTSYADEVSELALAHVSSDSTRAAYARDSLLDKRRLLMNDWAKFCLHGPTEEESDNVIEIGGRRYV